MQLVPGGRKRRAHSRIRILAAAAATILLGSTLSVPPAASQATDGCPWMNELLPPARRAAMLLSAMTLDEKVALLAGEFSSYGFASQIPTNERLCIPQLVFSDGPAGVAGGFGGTQSQVTAFPAPMSTASAWDPGLQARLGHAMGREAFSKGANVFLAPALNIARVPMNGRNYEYFGEDPFLAGETAAAVTRGIQRNPVVATVKHYAVNNQETNRGSVSAEVGERVLREIYLPGFEAAVKQAHAGAAMCAYNKVNGDYACENRVLLNRILKNDWGFDGWVMSDWGATHSTVKSARAGLDQEQNGFAPQFYGDQLKAAVQEGKISTARLNDMVLRIIETMFRRGLFDKRPPGQPGAYSSDASSPGHRQLAREVAEAGSVLLKNQRRALPLDRIGSGKTIAVIGRPASPEGAALVHSGSGSAHVHAVPVDPLSAIRERAARQSASVVYADGGAIADAVAVASAADVAVVFVRDLESEGNDRKGLALNDGACAVIFCQELPSNQDQLVEAVAEANPNTVVVLATGGPVLMPWLDQVKAVLEVWYPGMEYGNAVASVLFGDVNPSGKLPQTFPRKERDLPTRTPEQYPGVDGRAIYSEGLLVGYRWFDAKRIKPLFPFGHGLSYTKFAFDHLSGVWTADGSLRVGFDITNTGNRAGAEIAQVYVAGPPGTGEPPKQLKGFDKLFLRPGETSHATVTLGPRAFAYWDVRGDNWAVAPGVYEVLVGSSSRDVRLRAVLTIAS